MSSLWKTLITAEQQMGETQKKPETRAGRRHGCQPFLSLAQDQAWLQGQQQGNPAPSAVTQSGGFSRFQDSLVGPQQLASHMEAARYTHGGNTGAPDRAQTTPQRAVHRGVCHTHRSP